MFRSTMFPTVFAPRDLVDRLADRSFAAGPFQTVWSRGGNGLQSPAARPIPIDVYTTEEAAVIVAAIPGVSPDAVELSVYKNTVTISGAMPGSRGSGETNGVTWWMHEIPSGSFRRFVTLPFPVNDEEVQATFEHGVLRVTLPKAEIAKPKRIAIAGGETAGQTAIGANAG